MSKLRRVISGGQTSVDQAALRAARAAGLETGGWSPKGWLTEDGPPPWLANYGLAEDAGNSYSARAAANVADSDGTLWIGDSRAPGCSANGRACEERLKSMLWVVSGHTTPLQVAHWLEVDRVEVLNVAGGRESIEPGIGGRAERFLERVFRLVLEGRDEGCADLF